MYKKSTKGLFVKSDRMENFINTVDPIITKNCNLLCPHCWGYNCGNANMVSEVYQKFIDFVKFLGINDIQFTGGEPLLNRDFINFAKINKNYNFNTRLRTNFSIKKFDEKSILDILENFSHVYISLDGDYKTNFLLRPTKKYVNANVIDKTNDDFIEKSANENFDIIKSNLDILLKVREKINSKVKVVIASVVQRKNIDKMSELLEFTNLYNDIRWDITQIIVKKGDENGISKKEFIDKIFKIAEQSTNLVKIKPASKARCLQVDVDGTVTLSHIKDIVIGNCTNTNNYENIKLKLENFINKNSNSYCNYYFIPNNLVINNCIW